jgi:hypothetical protein
MGADRERLVRNQNVEQEVLMNQVAFLQSTFARRFLVETPTERCDLPLLTDIVVTAMLPVLERRNQTVKLESVGRPAIVNGELKLVFALLSAVILEAAGLSSARANLRVAFDVDDGDAVVTIVGCNSNHLPRSLIRLDRELSELARQGGAELELLWDEHEGPTLVLRFLNSRASVAH